jgi:hypothetical protein
VLHKTHQSEGPKSKFHAEELHEWDLNKIFSMLVRTEQQKN